RMPPKEKLADDQIAIIEKWVKMGAPDPRATTSPAYKPVKELWSAKPIQRTPPPDVKSKNWVHDPADAFVLASLDKRKLTPVTAADKRTLIRRATFDLLGLPPTPEEVEAFVRDNSDKAFEQVIDRLLKSPHFGERWGRHWLDLACYADSNGLDNPLPINNAW